MRICLRQFRTVLVTSAEWEKRATGRRPSVADGGGGMSASCKLRVQLFADAGSDSRIVCCGIISSCRSAVSSEIVKLVTGMFRARSVRSAIGPSKYRTLPFFQQPNCPIAF